MAMPTCMHGCTDGLGIDGMEAHEQTLSHILNEWTNNGANRRKCFWNVF